MKESFNRWVFVQKTRIKVAYGNYFIEKTFNPHNERIDPKKYLPFAVVFLMIFLGAGISSALFVEKPRPLATATVGFPTDAGIVEKTLEEDAEKGSISQPMPENLEGQAMAAIPPSPPILKEIAPAFAIAVDKSTKTLFVLRENADHFDVVNSFDVSLGKTIGVKEKEGDLKTPEGIYTVTEIKNGSELPDMYGPRAFVLNYPNSYDQMMGRTGGGIWLHGTGKGERTPDTKGCVELADWNILKLDEWVGKNTRVAIFPSSFHLPVLEGKIEKRYLSSDFFYGTIIAQNGTG